MSDCGCKKDANGINEKELGRIAFTDSLFMRIFIFLISLVIVALAIIPVIIPLMVIMLFNRIVLQKGTDISVMFLSIGKLFKKRKNKEEDDSDDISGDINPEDYELMDVDVIK